MLHTFAVIASQKTWPKEKLTADEIYNILCSKSSLNFSKIDEALLEVKRTGDKRYINIITTRKIEKNEKKKFFFDDHLKLCCPIEHEIEWNIAVNYYTPLNQKCEKDEYSDNFEWASDESHSDTHSSCDDYIVHKIQLGKNIVKDMFDM